MRGHHRCPLVASLANGGLNRDLAEEVDTEIIRVERELAQTRAVLNVIKAPDQEQELSIRYSISRRSKGSEVKLIEANASSLLMPGDLLAVIQDVYPQK